MKRVQFVTIMLLILLSVSFAGCTLIAGKAQAFYYERPAIGLTVGDEVITDVDLQRQSTLMLSAKNGIIKITSYDGDQLQIIEKRKLTGLSTKKLLKAILEKNRLVIEKDDMKVELKSGSDEKQKPFFRMTEDIELKVPAAFMTMNITAQSGGIEVSGIKGLNSLDLTISKGNIKVDGCEAYLLLTSITNGNLDVGSYYGNGSYKCGRGNISLSDTSGNIELKSLSGETVIENADGKLDCEVSTGSLTVRSSKISGDSRLYVSSGTIDADLTNIEDTGKYTMKASKGEIKVSLSETKGWSLLAESTKGRITDNLNLPAGELERAPSGEIYGDVHGGGPTIDVYVDMGNIIFH